MFKYRIVILIALWTALSVVASALLFRWMSFESTAGSCLFLLSLLVITFLATVYLLNKDIYHRIESLYKLIYTSGTIEEKSEEIQLKKIEENVLKWSQEKRSVIQKLKDQEKYRREFIGDVAHELKTPIFNIQGYVCTLIDGGLQDERINKKYLRKAQKNINRMIHIVQDLDLITKLESGELVVTKKKFSLVQAIEEAIEEVEMRAMEKDINLYFHREKTEQFVCAEKDHIMRVLINLISNSVKYGKNGGETHIFIRNKLTSQKVYVRVEDNGVGIKKEDLPRIFERFYRVDKSRSRNEGGSGLGLSIVKHILEVHGESITVKSTFGKGASFEFSLQKAQEFVKN